MATAKENKPVEEKKPVQAQAQSALLAGFSDDDFYDVGGLTPIYSSKEAWENKFPEVYGFPYRIEELPPISRKNAKGEIEVFVPKMIRFFLAKPTKATVGKRGARQIVDRLPEEEVLVPVTGNLGNNKDLLMAVNHSTDLFLCRLSIIGQVPLELGDMWDWHVQLNKKRIKREGRFLVRDEGALVPLTGAGGAPALGPAGGTVVHDPRTGEVQENAPVARA